jgi:hypothetical protein
VRVVLGSEHEIPDRLELCIGDAAGTGEQIIDSVGENAFGAFVAGVVPAWPAAGATAGVERAASAGPTDEAASIAADQDANLSTARASGGVIVQRDVAGVADRSERDERLDRARAAAASASPWDAGRAVLADPLAGVVAMSAALAAALAADGGDARVAGLAEVGLAIGAAAGDDADPVATSAECTASVVAAVAVDAEGSVVADEDDSAHAFAARAAAWGRGPAARAEPTAVVEAGDDPLVATALGAGLCSEVFLVVAGVADPAFWAAGGDTGVCSSAA